MKLLGIFLVKGIGNRESGIGNRESGVGSRESGIGSQISNWLLLVPPLLRGVRGDHSSGV
ncbi:MAG: hypothetical protein F6J98_19435 [Moorea sp. SIO4G2]|uniref:hypothetical protein n=1 Tax=unclassified Moorena TaxID=2683338 RepID=UPI0013FCE90E|nr:MULTISPECIES: hypothetical protein [unclassified Moorena]NEO17621.1 hypothetical protein [Moorena sp. SIO3E8]NEO45181.1 hypothetical protein [Moorena sp. SIO4A3]NEO62484.1 hypothetical protein [Moorena sp. SIO4G2]NEQ03903.1 hypothetical protein [Moorena sp. SIO3F7]